MRGRANSAESLGIIASLHVLIVLSVCGQSEMVIARNTVTPQPGITITRVPPKGAGPDVMRAIGGRVTGVDPKHYRVVIFARTNTWYVQPYAAAPYTAINDDGKWEAQTHLGDEYAALLVEPSYEAPATIDALPDVTGHVLAIARAARSRPNERQSESQRKERVPVRTIQFSGYRWRVKSSNDLVGPGPNYFSDGHDNVEVDAKGRLHLKITQRNGRWYCAEIILERSLGYGTYRFHLDTNVVNIDSRVVLGLFTWSDDSAYSHREIDIEISRWGNVANKNAQFVVQPYTDPANIIRFQIPSGVRDSTHSFRWQPGNVSCLSVSGLHSVDPEANSILQQHVFTQDIPQPGNENVRINLWLVNAEPPASGKQVEIIISRFQFVS